MNTVSAIASSGLRAAQLSLGTSAHNIANAQTPGFRRQRVAQEAQAEGGVSATLVTAPQDGAGLDDLASDVVQQKVASYAFQANLLVLRTNDRMQGSLLDLFA